MDNNNSTGSGQGKFINGFLLGVIVGGAIVFLLGTRKGKRILKALSEGGIENISNVLKDAENSDEIENEVVEKAAEKEVLKPKVKRFFRGISKRFN